MTEMIAETVNETGVTEAIEETEERGEETERDVVPAHHITVRDETTINKM